MHLPPHAEVSVHEILAVAQHYELGTDSVVRLPDAGIFNAVYLLGDAYILRVPREHPGHYAALSNESVAVPRARQAGVRTPALLVYDDSCTLLPVPSHFLHGDTQSTSIVVEPDTLRYLAVLDWGSAEWGDPAWDFAGIPLRAVPDSHGALVVSLKNPGRSRHGDSKLFQNSAGMG